MATMLIPTAFADDGGKTLNLYILTGQSNSLGVVRSDGASEELLNRYTTDSTNTDSTSGVTTDILMWNGNYRANNGLVVSNAADRNWSIVAPQDPVYNGSQCMGPEYGFAYMMSKKGWGVSDTGTIAIIKSSLDGQGNSQWVKPEGQSSSFYTQILNTVAEAVGKLPSGTYSTVNIAGLLYLQGESNNDSGGKPQETLDAAGRFSNLVSNLNADLAARGLNVTVTLSNSAVAGEPASWANDWKTKQSSATAEALRGLADGTRGMEFVFTRDLGKIRSDSSVSDTLDVHYTGKSQITIGARYAYATALAHNATAGENDQWTIGAVRSDYYDGFDYHADVSTTTSGGNTSISGVTLSQGATKISLNDKRAWWDTCNTYTAEAPTLSGRNETVVWDVSSANQEDTLSGDFSVAGIRVEDPYRSTVVIKNLNNSTNATLDVGSGGITLQGANLTISTDLRLSGDNTWTLESGRTLTLAGGIDLNGHAASLVLGDGATFSLGDSNHVQLQLSSLVVGEGASVSFNLTDSANYDTLVLGDGAGFDGTLNVKVDIGNKVKAGNYVLVSGWTGDATSFTYTPAAGRSASLALSGTNLVLTVQSLSGLDYGVVFPDSPVAMNGLGNQFAWSGASGAQGESFKVLTRQTGTAFVAAAYNSTATGNVHLKIGEGSATTADGATAVFGAWQSTITGNVYVELDAGAIDYEAKNNQGNADSNWASVNGLYGGSSVSGSLTFVIRDGVFSSYVVGGNSHSGNPGSVDGGGYLQVDDGTFSTDVYGGSHTGVTNGSVGTTTIGNGTHLLINGGTFNGMVIAGNGSGATNASISGGTHMVISGGEFNGIVAGGNSLTGTVSDGGAQTEIKDGTFFQTVYGGNYSHVSDATGGTITGNANLTISGGTFKGNVVGGNGTGGTIDGDVNLTINGGTFTGNVTAGNSGLQGDAKGVIKGDLNLTINGGTFSNTMYVGGFRGTVDGASRSINLTITGGTFSGGIYAGFGTGDSTGSGISSTVTLRGITDQNDFYKSFVANNRLLSGKGLNGSVSKATLKLDAYTASRLTNNFSSFDAIQAVNGTSTQLSTLGGATSIGVDSTSSLTLTGVELGAGTTVQLGFSRAGVGGLSFGTGVTVSAASPVTIVKEAGFEQGPSKTWVVGTGWSGLSDKISLGEGLDQDYRLDVDDSGRLILSLVNIPTMALGTDSTEASGSLRVFDASQHSGTSGRYIVTDSKESGFDSSGVLYFACNQAGFNGGATAEVHDVGTKWLAAIGNSSVSSGRPDGVTGDYRIITASSAQGAGAVSYEGAYGAISADSPEADVFVELSNPNATYGDVYAVYQANVDDASITLDSGSVSSGIKGVYGKYAGTETYFGSISGGLSIVVNGGTVKGSITAGGSGTISGGAEVTLAGGTFQVEGSNTAFAAYGGSDAESGSIKGGVQVTMGKTGGSDSAVLVFGSIYGGNNTAGTIEGGVQVDILSGKFNGSAAGVFGGNKSGGTILGLVEMNISGGSLTTVHGGNQTSGTVQGELLDLIDGVYYYDDAVQLNIAEGNFNGKDVYGGNGSGGTINGNVGIMLAGGSTIASLYGGNETGGTINGDVSTVIATPSAISGNIFGGNKAGGDISGKASLAFGSAAPATYTLGPAPSGDDSTAQTVIANVYGGNDTDGTISGGVSMTIDSGNFGDSKHKIAVYGGNNSGGTINGGVDMTINNGTFGVNTYSQASDVYAGNASDGSITDGVQFTINGGTFYGGVYGGNNTGGSITGGVKMKVTGGTFWSQGAGLFGGNGNGTAESTASISGGVDLEISGGTLGSVYSGNRAAGTINGGVKVTVSKGSLGLLYGGNADGGTINGGVSISLSGGSFSNFVYGGNANGGTINDGVSIVVDGADLNGKALIGGGTNGSISGGVAITLKSGNFTYVYGGNNGADASISGGVKITVEGGVFSGTNGMLSGAGNAGTVDGDIELVIKGGDFRAWDTPATNRGIFAGSAWGGSVINGNTKVVLQGIDNANSFAEYTGKLSGKSNVTATHKPGTTATLELDNFTATALKAAITYFDSLSAVNSTNTKVSTLGGATNVSIDATSALTIEADSPVSIGSLSIANDDSLAQGGLLTAKSDISVSSLALAGSNAKIQAIGATVTLASLSDTTYNNGQFLLGAGDTIGTYAIAKDQTLKTLNNSVEYDYKGLTTSGSTISGTHGYGISLGNNSQTFNGLAITTSATTTAIYAKVTNSSLSAASSVVSIYGASGHDSQYSFTDVTVGGLTVGADVKGLTISGEASVTGDLKMAAGKSLTLSSGASLTNGAFKLESNLKAGEGNNLDGVLTNSHTGEETLKTNSAYVFRDMTVTLSGDTAFSGDAATFFAGVDNASFVYNHAGSLKMNLSWRDSGLHDFHDLEVKQGTLEFSNYGSDGSNGNDINISGTAKVSTGATLVIGSGTSQVKTGGLLMETGGTLRVDSSTTISGSSETSALHVTTAEGATGNGKITINGGKKLTVVNADISNIDFDKVSGSTGNGKLEISAGEAVKATVGIVEGEGTGTLGALMKDCSLKNTDIVINASGATDAAAKQLGVENFYNKEFTLNIMSNVTMAESGQFMLELAGMENYRDIQLHWSVSVQEPAVNALSLPASGSLEDTPAATTALTGSGYADYTGAVLFTTTAGTVVNVWATYTVPEPATGALSVLALAALAARRRRK